MDIGLRLPNGPIPPGELAAEAESRGFSSVWTGELWGDDAFVRLARAATATERVALGTAIVNVYSRTPAVLAMAAASVDTISDGRARLGVGASTARAIEGIHGLEYDRPVRRTHEAAAIIKRLFGDGEPVTYDGEVLSVERVPPLDVDVPVYNAALGPANRRATGRLCDGWIPHNIPWFALDDAFEVVAEAANQAGRDPDAIRVAPYVPTAVADDQASARTILRDHIAYYVGSGEGYRRAVAAHFPEAVETAADRWADGDRDEARLAITEEMVESLGIAGTPETAGDRFRSLVEGSIIDEPLLVFAGRPDADRVQRTVDAIAPDG